MSSTATVNVPGLPEPTAAAGHPPGKEGDIEELWGGARLSHATR
jgi:hypothetical protein